MKSIPSCIIKSICKVLEEPLFFFPHCGLFVLGCEKFLSTGVVIYMSDEAFSVAI